MKHWNDLWVSEEKLGVKIVGNLGNGYKAIRNNKFVVISNLGKDLTDREYDRIFTFRNNMIKVQFGGYYCLIDSKFKEVIPCLYNNILYTKYTDSIILEKDNKWKLINITTGEECDLNNNMEDIYEKYGIEVE